ncbi:MAG: PAS domain S-box protein [Deltaproteobacteria bacterium]|nr:PAS domain S-box protein [Deltaproteobacteria bacterium]
MKSRRVALTLLASVSVILVPACTNSQILLQLYYIPVLMMSLWWGIKGWSAGVLFLLTIPFVHMIFGPGVNLESDLVNVAIIAVTSLAFLGILKGLGGLLPGQCPDEKTYVEDRIQDVSMDDPKARYEALFESANELIITTDPNGYIMRMNKKAEELLGYKKEELIGKSILILAYPEDKAKFIHFWKDLLSGLIARYELRVLAKTGYVAHVLASGNTIKDADGNVLEIQYNAQDISESKRAEIRLNEEKERAQQYLDIAGTMIVAISADQRVELVNKKGLEILGYERQEIIGKNWFDTVIPERHRSALRQLFQRIINGDLDFAQYHENAVVTKSGEERIMAWNNSLIRDRQGKIVGTLSSGLDITEKKQTEEKLIQARNRFKNLFENANEMIITVDPQGTILSVNKKVEEITGYSSDDILGKPVTIFSPPDYIERFKEMRRETLRGTVRCYETKIAAKNGGLIDVLASASIIEDGDGNVKEMQYNAQDITPLKVNEKRLKDTNQKLLDALKRLKDTQTKLVHEQRMASTGYLAATMAHEINNPLSFTISNLSTLGKYLDPIKNFFQSLDELKPRLPETVRKDLETVQDRDIVSDARDIIKESLQGAERIKGIVESLKEFSHVDKPYLSQVSINKLLDSTLAILSHKAGHVQIEKDYRDIPYIEGYGGELAQAFKCIIENALQAVGNGGKVFVKTMSENSKVRVLIEDTGCGIKNQDIDRVFDPFYTTKNTPEAKGLGLSIAQRTILMHKGDIDINSSEGKGTRVSITLPMKQEVNQEVQKT